MLEGHSLYHWFLCHWFRVGLFYFIPFPYEHVWILAAHTLKCYKMLFKESTLLSCLEPKVEHKLCVTSPLTAVNDTVLHLRMAEFIGKKRKYKFLKHNCFRKGMTCISRSIYSYSTGQYFPKHQHVFQVDIYVHMSKNILYIFFF